MFKRTKELESKIDKLEQMFELLVKQNINELPSETKEQKEKREELEKSWAELFSYSEYKAIKGVK